MKIRVIVPFTDKMFNDEITRAVGDIIDTEDAGFKCDEALAQQRIKTGFCELVEEVKPVEVVKETPKPAKKGKKASKKK